MDLQKVINEQTQALMASGAVEEMVKANLEKCIADLVKEQFSYGSPIKKSLEEAMEGALNIDLSDISLSEMFTFVTDHAKTELHRIISEEAKSKYIDEVNSILKPLPDEMTLESFAEQIIEFWREEDTDKSDWDDNANIECETNNYGSDTLIIKVGNSSSTEKEVHLYLGKDQGGYHTVRISHGMQYNPTCLGQEEAFIFKAYTQGVKLTGFESFDEHNIDTNVKQDNCW